MRHATPTRSLSMLPLAKMWHNHDRTHGAWPGGSWVMEDWGFSMPAYQNPFRTQWYLSLEPPIQAPGFSMANSQTPLSRYQLSALVS